MSNNGLGSKHDDQGFALSAIAVSVAGNSASTAVAKLVWDLPTQNTNATTLTDMKTFKVYYGRTSGSYTNMVNLGSTSIKAALEYEISGMVGVGQLAANDTIYARVTAVDQYDTESVQSNEVVLTAVVGISPDYSGYTEISSLPYTISASGNYKFASSLVSDSGNALTISASDVVIYGNSNSLTYADTGAGSAFKFAAGISGVEIHGFSEITQGAYNGGAEHAHLVDANNNTNNSNIKIHSNTLTICKAYNGANRAFIYNSRDFAIGNDVLIYNNTINISSDDIPENGGMGLVYVNGNGTGCKIFGNTINVSNAGSGGSYTRVINVGHGFDVYGNTIDIADTCNRVQIFSAWGTANGFVHDNVVTDSGQQTRAYLNDGGANGVRYLWESYTGNRVLTTNANDGAIFRARYGTYDISMAFCNLDASASTKMYGVRIGGHESLPAASLVRPHDIHLINNIIKTGDRNCLQFEGGVLNVHSQDNSYDGGSAYDIAAGDTANGITEGLQGSSTTCENFQSKDDTLVNSNVNNNGGAEDWIIENSFSAGNINGTAGSTSMVFNITDIFPSAKTPNAPIARAA